ncbi:YfiR family protein [bacterium]|nr:YfiR family protein [bacterium]
MRLHSSRKIIVFTALAFCLASDVRTARAQETFTSEYEIKAAFLFNFAKFIDWPVKPYVEAETHFAIGVLGRDPFGDALEQTIGGKTVKGRAIVIRRFRHISEYKPCDILFISESEKPGLPEIVQRLRRESVLTVSDMPEFGRRGGMIYLFTEDNKVRFSIRTDLTDRAGLRLGSRLLNLSRPQPD